MTFIHYGSKKFVPGKMQPIKNRFMTEKPEGGLWGSPIDSQYGWKWFIETNGHEHDFSVGESFLFTLSAEAKIIELNNIQDIHNLPVVPLKYPFSLLSNSLIVYPDFEKLLHDGVDAILYNSEGCADVSNVLGSWDCDSILVMNPDVIVPVGTT